MPGRVYEMLFDVAVDQHGYVTTENARDLGIDPGRLTDLAHRGHADHVSHGLYRMRAVPVAEHDQLMEAVLWPRGLGVISHDTALDLWDLCDVNPLKVHVTIPAAARLRRHRTPAAYQVHERDLDPRDVTRLDGIPVVAVRRAILDGIERPLGPHLIDQALDRGRRTGQLTRAQVAEINQIRAR